MSRGRSNKASKVGVAKKTVARNSVARNSAGKKAVAKTDGVKTASGPKYMLKGQICVVCGDRSTGAHYKAMTCEGCKGFFRRLVQKSETGKPIPQCMKDGNCVITVSTRNSCQACRFKKCLAKKMEITVVMNADQRKEHNSKKSKTALKKKRENMDKLSVPEQSHIEQIAESYKSPYFRDFFWIPLGFLKCGQKAVASMPHLPGKGSAVMHTYNFVLNIPGIHQIDNEDLATLIKHRLIDVMALQMAEIYDPKENVLKFCNVTIQESDTLSNEMLHRIFKYAKHYSQFCTEHGKVLGCLCAVRFLNADALVLKDREKVQTALKYVLNISNKVWIEQKTSISKLLGGLCDFEEMRAMDKDKLLWKISANMEDEESLEHLGRDLSARLAASILLNMSARPSLSSVHSACTSNTVSPPLSDSAIHGASASNNDSAIDSASTSNNNTAIHSASTSNNDSAIHSASTSHTASALHSAQSSLSTSPGIDSSASCPSNIPSPAAQPVSNDSNDVDMSQAYYRTYPIKMESGGQGVQIRTELINTSTALAQLRITDCTSGTTSQQPVCSPARPIKREYMSGDCNQFSAPVSSPTYHSRGTWSGAPAVSSFPRAPGTLMKTTNDHAQCPLDLSLHRGNQAYQGSPAQVTSLNRLTSRQYPGNHPQHMMAWLAMEESRKQPAPEDDSQIIAFTPSQFKHFVENLQSQNTQGFQGQASNGENCFSEEERVQRSNQDHIYLERASQGSAGKGLYSSEPARLVAHPELARALSTRQLAYHHTTPISPQYPFHNVPFANRSSSEQPFNAPTHMAENNSPPQCETFQSIRPLGDQNTIQALYPVDAYRNPPGHAPSNQGTFPILQNYQYHPNFNRYDPGAPSQMQTSQQYSSLQDDQNHQASTGYNPSTSTVEDATKVSAPSGSSVNRSEKGTRAGKVSKASNKNVSVAARMRNQLSTIGVKKTWLQAHLKEKTNPDAE